MIFEACLPPKKMCTTPLKILIKEFSRKHFAKSFPDILCGDADYCNIMHADGAGTKSSLAYAYWKETGDMSVWKGIAQDSLIMNLDDLLCVGATDNIFAVVDYRTQQASGFRRSHSRHNQRDRRTFGRIARTWYWDI